MDTPKNRTFVSHNLYIATFYGIVGVRDRKLGSLLTVDAQEVRAVAPENGGSTQGS